MDDETKHLYRLLRVAEDDAERLRGDLAVCRANWAAARTLAAMLWRGSVLATPAYIIEAREGGMHARHVAPGETRRNVGEAALVALCELLGAVETGEGD